MIVPSSIKHDGSRDVTNQLNEFLAGCPLGSTVSFQKNGHYRVDGTLELTDWHGTIAMAGSLFDQSHVQGDSHRACWRATGGGPIYWRNGTIKGSRPTTQLAFEPALQWQHGFDLQGVTGYDIAFNVIVKDNWGDGVYNGAGTSNGIIHSGASFFRNGRMAVALTHASSITIGAIHVIDPCMNVIDIEPNGPQDNVTNVKAIGGMVAVTRKDPQPFHSLLYAGNPGQLGGHVAHVSVEGWSLNGYPVAVVVEADPSARWAMFDVHANESDVDVFTDSTGRQEFAGLTFYNVDGVTYGGNAVNPAGVDIQNCTGVVTS